MDTVTLFYVWFVYSTVQCRGLVLSQNILFNCINPKVLSKSVVPTEVSSVWHLSILTVICDLGYSFSIINKNKTIRIRLHF